MFDLTREERRVILFLASVALLGMGVNFLAKRYSLIREIACFNEDAGKIDLNKAGRDLLITIPGIGEKLASRIIEYRAKQAYFKDLEELKNIKGISGSKYEKIKNYLTVE